MNDFLSIVTAISGLLISLTAILTTFGKFRKWAINKLASDIDFTSINKRSELYKIYEKIDVTEDEKKKIIESIENLNKEQMTKLTELQMSVLRLEIGRIIDHEPENKTTIYHLYDKYREMGGNSYMIERIKEWEKTNK